MIVAISTRHARLLCAADAPLLAPACALRSADHVRVLAVGSGVGEPLEQHRERVPRLW